MQLSLLFRSAIALVAASVVAAAPTAPSADPFYDQPANISSYAAGAIVKSRTLPPRIQGLQPFASITVGAALQYMYRTTDSLGKPVGAVMTYLVPQKPDNTKLLSYSIPYDSANIDCSPSYSIQPGANTSLGFDTIFIQASLNNGWHVVTSDFEGLQAQFVAGIQSGNAVLDSIRASLNSTTRASTNLTATAKYAMYGYSGGALGAEWAAEMAPTYAKDLTNFVGVALGGLTPNVTSVLLTINGGPAAYLAFVGTYGLSKAYSNFSNYLLTQQLLPAKRDQYFSIAGACSSAGTQGFGQDFFSYFQAGRGLLQNNIFTSVLDNAGQMGIHGTPKQPIFAYKALGDEVSPIGDTDELLAKYCNEGVTFQYQRNSFGEHITEGILGTPAAFSWLEDRFNGVAIDQPTRCYTQNVTVADVADSGADKVFAQSIVAALQATLGDVSPPWNNTNQTYF